MANWGLTARVEIPVSGDVSERTARRLFCCDHCTKLLIPKHGFMKLVSKVLVSQSHRGIYMPVHFDFAEAFIGHLSKFNHHRVIAMIERIEPAVAVSVSIRIAVGVGYRTKRFAPD